uniref:Uncharacterized protein n=1 Tax=Neogobius melanostomus TaxID=47308 RepID=A0A8C6U876_9GOBI
CYRTLQRLTGRSNRSLTRAPGRSRTRYSPPCPRCLCPRPRRPLRPDCLWSAQWPGPSLHRPNPEPEPRAERALHGPEGGAGGPARGPARGEPGGPPPGAPGARTQTRDSCAGGPGSCDRRRSGGFFPCGTQGVLWGPHGPVPQVRSVRNPHHHFPAAQRVVSPPRPGPTSGRRGPSSSCSRSPAPAAEDPPPLFHQGAPYPPPLFLRDSYHTSLPQPPPRRIKRSRRRYGNSEEPTCMLVRLRPRQVLCDRCKGAAGPERPLCPRGAATSRSRPRRT